MFTKKKILEYFSSLFTSGSERKKEENNAEKNQLKFRCPQCQHIFLLDSPPVGDSIRSCPKCGQTGIIRSSEKKQNEVLKTPANRFINYRGLTDTEKESYKPVLRVKFIGILFIIIGMIVLIALTPFNLKLSFTLILIGAIILGIIPDNKYLFVRRKNKIKKIYFKDSQDFKNNSSIGYKLNASPKQFGISEKIALAIILSIIFFYFVTGVTNIEIFLIFINLGILIIKELADEFIPDHLKKRMNILIIALLAIFLIIVIQRIINSINI